MKACFHECVCRHLGVLNIKPDDACPIIETCKYHAKPDLDEPKKGKRQYKRRIQSDQTIRQDTDIDTSGITEKQFKKAKKKIVNVKQNKGLDENQELALKAIKGLHFKKMSGIQKQQIMDIADDL